MNKLIARILQRVTSEGVYRIGKDSYEYALLKQILKEELK